MRTLSIRTPHGISYVAGYRIVGGLCVGVSLSPLFSAAIPVASRYRATVTKALGARLHSMSKGAR